MRHGSASRRDFLTTAAAAAGTTAALSNVHAAGSDVLRVGLIGCGDRGTGAAAQALSCRLERQARRHGRRLRGSATEEPGNPPEGREGGRPSWTSSPTIVSSASTPTRRSSTAASTWCCSARRRTSARMHLQAAVEAGKHVFAEKPVAVDAPGVRSVLATCELAKKKGLSVVSGLCLRYDNGFRETVQRIHDGAIGDVVALFANDYRSGRWAKPRQPDWTDMEYQMRNWYNFTWLSGDFNVEQHVHFLDVCAWVMKDQYPVKAIGMGGRQVRTEPEYGQIYDHFSVVYEYANGAKLVSNCRQQPRCKNDMSAHVLGTKGPCRSVGTHARAFRSRRQAGTWTYDGPQNQMYQTEHDELFASIRNGKPINNGEYMAKSTLLAIMGRMAAYTGQEITWEMAMKSKEDLTPPGTPGTASPRCPDRRAGRTPSVDGLFRKAGPGCRVGETHRWKALADGGFHPRYSPRPALSG